MSLFSNIEHKLDIIRNTNPNRIYVENIRSFYNISTFEAKFFCDLAVREGLFIKKYGVTCPNKSCRRIIATFSDKKAIPKKISCSICESSGEDYFEFDVRPENIVTFYQLKQ
jgi:hypothetical protein